MCSRYGVDAGGVRMTQCSTDAEWSWLDRQEKAGPDCEGPRHHVSD